jgi:hypothetical protein
MLELDSTVQSCGERVLKMARTRPRVWLQAGGEIALCHVRLWLARPSVTCVGRIEPPTWPPGQSSSVPGGFVMRALPALHCRLSGRFACGRVKKSFSRAFFALFRLGMLAFAGASTDWRLD